MDDLSRTEPVEQPPLPVPAPTDTGAPPTFAAAPLAARTAARPRGTRLLNVALGGAVVLAIAGVAFAAGRLTAPAPAAALGPNGQPGFVFNGGPNGQGGQNPNGQGGPGLGGVGGGVTIEGTVESVTDSTLTIRTADGQTIQVALDDTTTYHAQSDASADDVLTGGKVLVRVALRGSQAGGAGTGPSASDVTVVP